MLLCSCRLSPVSLPPQIVTDELQVLVTAVSSSVSLPEPVTATEFMSFDTQVVGNEVLTDTWQQDILTEYIGADEDDEEDDEDIPQLPLEISSNGDALDCCKHIKRFALEKDMPSLLSICMAGEAELIKVIISLIMIILFTV